MQTGQSYSYKNKQYMKNLFFIVTVAIVVGCSTPPNKQTSNEKETPKDVFIYPKDSYKFHFNGRHIIVQGIIGDSVEISLLFDTGAQTAIFDSTFISKNQDQLGFNLRETRQKSITPGGDIKFTSKINSEFNMLVLGDTFNIRKGFIDVADLAKTGLNVDALFPAYWSFSNKSVLMDLKHEYFLFLSEDTLDSIKSEFSVFPLIGNQVTYFRIPANLDISVANEEMNINGELMLDLGAPGFLYLQNSKEVLYDKSKPHVPIDIPENIHLHRVLRYTLNRMDTMTEKFFVADQIRMFDSLTFNNEHITVFSKFRISPEQVGILGNEFFRKFVVIFDFKNSLFYLKPNEEYKKIHFPYSLGMKLDRSANFKTLYVLGLYELSPAAESGIQLGDTILKINGNSTENITADELKALEYSKPGTNIIMDVKKNQEVLKYEFTIDSLSFLK